MTKQDENPQAVQYQKRGRVAYITLNRPDVLNAMNLEMHRQLLAVWETVNQDADVWVVVLAGEGAAPFRWDRISKNSSCAMRPVSHRRVWAAAVVPDGRDLPSVSTSINR
ncbi:enoyl-CoA hydratase/isomerase family protein [Rouxiella badensis]|nr:enoyl-CoA hydratase/isomerase family protein [Rouxiella badensis]